MNSTRRFLIHSIAAITVNTASVFNVAEDACIIEAAEDRNELEEAVQDIVPIDAVVATHNVTHIWRRQRTEAVCDRLATVLNGDQVRVRARVKEAARSKERYATCRLVLQDRTETS